MELTVIERVVRTFRPMGFFEAFADQSSEVVAAEIGHAPDPWSGPLVERTIDAEDPGGFSDLAVLAHDRARVWRLESWERLLDPSALRDGIAYCRDHADVVANLARIGAHRLSLRAEDASGGAMTLAVDGRRIPIRFETDLSVLSTDLIAQVNRAIVPSGHEYVFVSNRFCTGYVVLLAAADKHRLAAERGWTYW